MWVYIYIYSTHTVYLVFKQSSDWLSPSLVPPVFVPARFSFSIG